MIYDTMLNGDFMYITKIIYEEKEKLFKLVFDDDSSILINENTLIKCNIYKDKEIDEKDLNEIIEENKVYEATEKALKFLKKLRTKKEISNHLKEDGLDFEIINRVLKYLEEFNYIDDHQYASSFISDKLRINRYGPEKIKYLLLNKGVSSEIINLSLEEVEDDLIKENFLKDAQIKYNKVSSTKNAYEKTVKYLLSKGYGLDYVMKNIGEVIK